MAGCASKKTQDTPLGADYYYKRGLQDMDKHDYLEAQKNFKVIVDSFSGSEFVDSAQFMLAETYFDNEDYITAAFEYENVYREYPLSPFVSQAMFKRAVCYFHQSPKSALDQENTNLAIDEFNRFIDTYPHDELVSEAQKYITQLKDKLANKVYQNAEIYRKLKKYDSAILYYQFVISDYPQSTWVGEARFGIGQVFLNQKQYEKAREQFQTLVTSSTDKSLRTRAQEKLTYIENRTK